MDSVNAYSVSASRKMYELHYISARPNEPLEGKTMQFESLVYVVNTIISLLNDSTEFVEDIMIEKYIDQSEFYQTDTMLKRYYGDVGTPVASVQTIQNAIDMTGEYTYRIGTSDPTLYNTIGTIEFRVVSS